MKNYEATDNPDFWFMYQWGQELAKNNDDIIKNRNKFLVDYKIDTERQLDPSYYPDGWTAEHFNINGNGVASSGEIFYIKDSNSDLMMQVISIYNFATGKFLLEGYKQLPYPLQNRSKTFYKISPEKWVKFEEKDDLLA